MLPTHYSGPYGAIETGGTNIVCAIGSGPRDLDRITFPTTTPGDTIRQILSFFRERTAARPISAIGVGSFGPVDLHRSSRTFGFITSTPKPGWRNTDLVGPLAEFNLPVAFDTDVNAAALGEAEWGAGRGLHNLVYVTVGIGIGGGALVSGRPLHGLVHPEMGHVRIPHDLKSETLTRIAEYLVAPELDGDSGILGAIVLARNCT